MVKITGRSHAVKVEINGVEVPELRTVVFRAPVDALATIEVDTYATTPLDIELDGPLHVVFYNSELAKRATDVVKMLGSYGFGNAYKQPEVQALVRCLETDPNRPKVTSLIFIKS